MHYNAISRGSRASLPVQRRPLVQRHRFQLGGGLIFAVLLPWMLRHAFGIEAGDGGLLRDTLVAGAVAVILGYYLFQSLSIYPGLQASFFILPSFSISYSAVFLMLLLARVDYSRSLLFSGMVGCFFWYYMLSVMSARRRPPRIGVVPFGQANNLDDIGSVMWRPLSEPDLVQAQDCDAVVADLRADIPPKWERFLADATLNGVVVLHVKQLRESLTGRIQMDHLAENSFGSLIPLNAYLRVKVGFDFLTALTAGILLLPLLLVTALLIVIDSRGPALFRQTRVGYGGRPFTVYKFRTMRHCEAGTDQSDRESAMTGDGDPRVTRLGRFLRRTRIDELPQIINILRGEMSWIGPRPEAQVLSQWYEKELPFYRYRHVVRPGITGWAQVNQGHVADVGEVLGKLQYDFYYIRHFSPWLDALIIARTILTVVTGFGAR